MLFSFELEDTTKPVGYTFEAHLRSICFILDSRGLIAQLSIVKIPQRFSLQESPGAPFGDFSAP